MVVEGAEAVPAAQDIPGQRRQDATEGGVGLVAIDDEEGAAALVARLREEFPDANHHCWAFVVGPPGSTARVGSSDAGEPSGTAGRPMLEALVHGPVGDAAAVVVRWFGGVKLGTGGLARAYSGAVRDALEVLTERERSCRLELIQLVGDDHALFDE